MLGTLRAALAHPARRAAPALRQYAVATPASARTRDTTSAATTSTAKKSRWQLLKAARKAAPEPTRRVPTSGEAPARPTEPVGLATALDYVRTSSWAKFDESIDIAISLNVDSRHAAQVVRTHAALPHGTGARARVAILDGGETVPAEGVEGGEELLKEIVRAKGRNLRKRGVRVALAPAHHAATVARVAGRALGPRGLLPAVRDGTVVPDRADIGAAAERAATRWVRLRADRTGTVHARVGRVSMSSEQLCENALEIVARLNAARPAAVKKRYVQAVSISSTMGKSVRVDLEHLAKKSVAYTSDVDYE